MIPSEILVQQSFPQFRQSYDFKDTILYALGIGMGLDPLDERQLPFIFEEGLKAVPSMATVLASPGFWQRRPEFEIAWKKVLHGEQGFELIRPLTPEAEVIGEFRIVAIVDKGADKGLTVYTERTLRDAESGEVICRLPSTALFRGDGGAGSAGTPPPPPPTVNVDRAPDYVCELQTSPQAAAIYRLSGDFNPLHIVPEIARSSGFDRPIMHGLGTMGLATHAILRSVCDYDPAKLRSIAMRFSAPTYPGETIRTEIWREGDILNFRSIVKEREVVCLSGGTAKVI